MPDFCRHRGVPRDLLIWDESLISSDTTVLDLSYTETALMHCAKGASRPLLQDVLSRLHTAVNAEKEAQAKGIAPRIFTLLTEAESEAALVQIGRPYCADRGERNLFERAQMALRLMAHPVTLLDVASGDTGIGLMRYQIMVDRELDNIAVLDASFIVRELCKADPTIRNGTTTAMQKFKSYQEVLVKHTVAASGRYQFDGSKADRQRALRAAVDSIVSIPEHEHVLVFTYKEDRPADLIALLKEQLLAEGIDPEEVSFPLKPRFVFSTWGRHTTDNSHSHCKHVVLLGVLRMSRLQLGAAMAGQKDDPSFRMSFKDLLAVEHSELASNILQAANRGCCRLTTFDGMAMPMTIHLLTKEKQLQPLLEKAMPGLQWETVALRGDALAQPSTRTQQLARQIVDYVSALPVQSQKISLKAIYAATSTALAKDAKAEAMNGALLMLHLRALGSGGTPWVKSGLSLVR